MSSARSTVPWLGRQVLRTLYESIDLSSRVSSKRCVPNTPRLNPSSSSLFPLSGPRSSKASWWPFSQASRSYTNIARRRCTSGGLLLIGFAPNSPTAKTVVATCSAAADSTASGSAASNLGVAKLAVQAWTRTAHTGRGRTTRVYRRTKSSKSHSEKAETADIHQKKPPSSPPEPQPAPKLPETESSVSKYFHMPAIPHLPHRPTKEEFLAAANGFWERLKVRFKWISIRSMRPWNIDEWGAFVSWFLFGHLVWILVGTTTFFSLIILSINTMVAQGRYRLTFAKLYCGLTLPCRNTRAMGWGLLDRLCRGDRCFRIGNRSAMERWRYQFSECFRLPKTWTSKIVREQRLIF